MKDWLATIGGALIVILAVWLVVTFAPQVLFFLKGIIGVLAGMTGVIFLFFGINGIRAKKKRKGKRLLKHPNR